MHPVSTSSRRSRRMHVFAVPAVLAGAAVLILAGTAISQTVTPQSEDPVQHFIDCAGVLITAPDIHAAYCLPSKVPPELAAPTSASSPGEGSHCMLYESGAGGREQVTSPLIETDGLFISVSLQSNGGDIVGWQAKKNSGLLDLSAVAKYEAADFWEPVFAEHPGRLVLHPEAFYLLISREFVRIPPGVAAEMVAYDPTNGELRTHYAGFFDPGFGYGAGGSLKGTRAVLEVRAHDVPFMLEDGQPVARFAYERMAAEPARLYGDEAAASHFQQQGIALSRQFKPPAFMPRMMSATSEPTPRRSRRG